MMTANLLDANTLAERLREEQRQDYWLHLEAESALEKYPAKQHARRVVERLGVEEGLIYLPGQPLRSNEDSDMPVPFRQRRYFYYLSGVNEVDCHLTYDIKNDTLTLFIPKVDPRSVIYNGRGSTPSEALDKYDIDRVLHNSDLNDFVSHWFDVHKGRLYLLHAWQAPRIPGAVVVDHWSLLPSMNHARAIKDDHEIELIKKANEISSQAHEEVLAHIIGFKNESQVEGLFLDFCISRLAKNQAYAPIAGSGPNAGTLHYADNNEDFEDRQLLVLDAGCEWQLYASDITRTIPLSGDWPSEESKQIYQLVQRMQETCIKRVAPGVRYLDLHVLAHQIAIDGLLTLGIFHNGSKEEIYKAGTSQAFFMHGLGHHLGLDVHDPGQSELMSLNGRKVVKIPSLYPENYHVPVYNAEKCMAPCTPDSPHLEEGMVVTIEPGIYFSTYALNLLYLSDPVHSKFINVEVLQRYLPVGGCRIEDDILVTSRGYENLTQAPKGEEMLNIIRSQKSRRPTPRYRESTSSPKKTISTHPVQAEIPLRRAPGISRHTPEPILKPIERAATLPFAQKIEGPLSTTELKRASTLDVASPTKEEVTRKSSRARRGQLIGAQSTIRIPICGVNNSKVRHANMNYEFSENQGIFIDMDTEKPRCNDCHILLESLQRLRLKMPKPEEKPTAVKKPDSEVAPSMQVLWESLESIAKGMKEMKDASEKSTLDFEQLVQRNWPKLNNSQVKREKRSSSSLIRDMKSKVQGLEEEVEATSAKLERVLAEQTTLAGIASSSNDILSFLESKVETPKRESGATLMTVAEPMPTQSRVEHKPQSNNPFVPYGREARRSSASIGQGAQPLNSGQPIRQASSTQWSSRNNVPQQDIKNPTMDSTSASFPTFANSRPLLANPLDYSTLRQPNPPTGVPQQHTGGLTSSLSARPSLPNLRPQQSTHPWILSNRHSVIEPSRGPAAPTSISSFHLPSNTLNQRPDVKVLNQDSPLRPNPLQVSDAASARHFPISHPLAQNPPTSFMTNPNSARPGNDGLGGLGNGRPNRDTQYQERTRQFGVLPTEHSRYSGQGRAEGEKKTDFGFR